MIRSVKLEETIWNELPYKFEAGTPADRRGRTASASRSTTSTRPASTRSRGTSTSSSAYALDQLGELPFVTALRAAAPSGAPGIVSFNVEGVHPHDVAQVLDWEGVASAPGTTARSR